MQPATHRIRRQRWLCRARTPEEGFALRGSLREAQETAVPAIFERAFDAAVPGGEVVHLPRLELNLRLESVDDLADVLPDLLARALREQLGRRLGEPRGQRLAGRPGPAEEAEGAGWLFLPEGVETAEGVEEGRRPFLAKTARESRLDGLIAYLTTGALPWELAQEEAIALLEQFREIVGEELAAVLDRAPDARVPLPQRIAFFHRLLQVVGEERWGEVGEHMLRRLPEAEAGEIRRAAAGGAPAEVWWGLAAVVTSPPGPLSHLPPSPRERGRPALGLPGEGEDVDSKDLSRMQESSAFEQVSPSPGGRVGDGRGGQGVRSRPAAPAMASRSHEPTATTATPPTMIPAARHGVSRPDALPLPIRSAGLVLLHPFLPRLFESVGLLRAGEPGLPWASLPRAAALLHWLATGREEVFEFEVGFIKILLGRRPDESLLVSDGLLTAADLEEGEALLQAVISHWRALKSTTPAGLRASFLQRGGLLSEKEHGWHLQVAPVAFDLLLDHLPWGLGVVKLPWMTQPIFTDWPTS